MCPKRKILPLGPPPPPSSKAVSKVMKANVTRNTGPEILMRKALWKMGLRGYRLHNKKVPGRPDITFVKKRITIFVHGCFWHRCPKCKPSLPKTHRPFWRRKFIRNKERDRRKRKELERNGWKVFEFWECDVNKKADKLAKRVFNYANRLEKTR